VDNVFDNQLAIPDRAQEAQVIPIDGEIEFSALPAGSASSVRGSGGVRFLGYPNASNPWFTST
jgi:hypothetical protein